MPLADDGVRLVLVLARVLPSALSLTALSRGFVPRAIASSIALALTVALAPLAGPLAPALDLLGLATALVRELAIGGCFALALAFALLTTSWAVQLSHASSARDAFVRPLASAYALCACWLVLSLGGLRAFVVGLAESFRDAPLAGPVFDAGAFARGALQLVADAFATAFGCALPLLASVWLIDASLALLSRVLPAGTLVASVPSPLRSVAVAIAATLLLSPVAAHAPELVRAALEAARALTRAAAG